MKNNYPKTKYVDVLSKEYIDNEIDIYSIPKYEYSPDIILEKKELNEKIHDLLNNRLTLREEKIIKMVYGIGMNKQYTIKEIGECMGLEIHRIRQLKLKALKKLGNINRTNRLKEHLTSYQIPNFYYNMSDYIHLKSK